MSGRSSACAAAAHRGARRVDTPRRASFDHDIIRLPESYRGVAGGAAKELYRAALAHILAHFRFTPEKFPLRSLKPVQVALNSPIEDARVEQLALALYPGLSRLWQPFHPRRPPAPRPRRR